MKPRTLLAAAFGAALFTVPALAQLSTTGTLSTGQDRTTGVTAGSYTCPTITIDATGRVISAANGSCSGGGSGGSGPFTVLPAATGVAATDTANVLAAVASGGTIVIPPSSTCYQITGLNLTNKTGLIFQGEGPSSCWAVAGSAGGNWIDLAGANQISFRDMSITGTSPIVPSTLFFWAAVSGNGIVSDLSFDHVTINAYTAVTELFGYGFTRLDIRDSVWKQFHEGGGGANPSMYDAVVRLDAENEAALTSSNVTVAPFPVGGLAALQITVNNSWFIDQPASFGGGTQDANAAFICVGCGTLSMNGGGIESLGSYDLVLWWFSEGLAFRSVSFQASDGSITVANFVEMGGGTNGNLLFDNDLFSIPINGGAPFSIGAPVSGRAGGVSFLRVINPDVGGTYPGEHILSYDGFACSASTGYSPWLMNSQIESPSMSLVACGNLDPSVTLRSTTVVMGGGFANNSNGSWGPP